MCIRDSSGLDAGGAPCGFVCCVEREAVKGHIVVTGCAEFIGSYLTDRLLGDGHTVAGIDSFEDYYPRALKEANLEGARVNPAFTLHEANILDLTAEAAPGGPDGGGAASAVRSRMFASC